MGCYIKNVIFDLGGVMLEWDPIKLVASVCPDPAVQQRLLNNIFFSELWHQYDNGAFSEQEAVVVFSKRALISEEEMRRLMQAVLESLVPIPASLAIMREMKESGRKVYCLSNVNISCYSWFRGRYSFLGGFDGTVISGQLGIGKPDPRIFQHLLSEYNLTPGESIFIDDKAVNVDAACGLGIKGILFVSAEDCRKRMEAIGA